MVADLGVEVDGGWLFRGLALTVAAGECAALTGPNGAGKSTLLRCLYGVQDATEGSVSVCGQRPDERSTAFRRAVSVLLDDSALFDELTPRQHLDLLLRSFPDAVADPVALLASAGLDHRASVPVARLSAGQRRRLLLLGATARPHQVLLLDEPERALDTAGRDWLAGLVEAELAGGTAVVTASHHPALVDRVADSVVEFS
ncbi:ABC transporter ATP-binding protein [Goodfellowiella coeruleoviolacea]|uniref:ABC transporter n=1 Tax=Goodfellowiella coeruleoviolacea TaxID=334858 RepID=A0AAE3GJA8_9PSEU|nr:ABC transporter ATP-binding protein [Goodfellowiella coeruleoviolacea]MCP2168447.1 ABC transporter [Goodfellowiella coeruleoviolacea]